MLSKYNKMLKMMPEQAVRNKMMMDGVPGDAIEEFFRNIYSISSEMLSKYDKMMKMMPEQAVRNKMKLDGVHCKTIEKFFRSIYPAFSNQPRVPSHPPNHSTIQIEQSVESKSSWSLMTFLINHEDFIFYQLNEFINLNALLDTCSSFKKSRYNHYHFNLHNKYSYKFYSDNEFQSRLLSLCRNSYDQISVHLKSNSNFNILGQIDLQYLPPVHELKLSYIKFDEFYCNIHIIRAKNIYLYYTHLPDTFYNIPLPLYINTNMITIVGRNLSNHIIKCLKEANLNDLFMSNIKITVGPYTELTYMEIFFFLMCMEGKAAIVSEILRLGFISDVDIKGYSSYTPVIVACIYKHVDILNILLEAGANVNYVTEYENHNALKSAVKHDFTEGVKSLLQAGADLETENTDGETALIMAAIDGNFTIVSILLEAGANVNHRCFAGITPLMIAAEDNDILIVRTLLQKGAYFNAADSFILEEAISMNRIELVQILLEAGADVNHISKDGDHFLITAVKCGYIEIVRALIQHGSDVNILSNSGQSALMIACRYHFLMIAKLLIEAGADAKFSTADSFILEEAISMNRIELVQILLEAGAVVNYTSKDSDYVLITAVENGNVEIVRALIQHGSDVNVLSKLGESALMIACRNNFLQIAKLLVEAGADAKFSTADSFILEEAISMNRIELVQLLLKAGADVTSDSFILVEAISMNRIELVQILLEAGADVNHKSKDGNHLLITAVKCGYIEIVRALIQHGSGVNILSYSGQSALMIACRHHFLMIAKLLIEAGADVNFSTADSFILEEAISMNRIELVQILLEAGAVVNYTSKDSDYVLITAVENGYIEIVRALIQHGSDVNVLSKLGESALMIACRHHFLMIAELLVEAGANVNHRSFAGITPLMIAAEDNDILIVRTLLQKGAHFNAADSFILEEAISMNRIELVQILLEAGADVNHKSKDLDYVLITAVDECS